MNQLTTIASMPAGAGQAAALEPEVDKSPERPKLNAAELRAAINGIMEANAGLITDAYRRSIIYGEGWGLGICAQAQNPNPLANLGYQVNARGLIERLK